MNREVSEEDVEKNIKNGSRFGPSASHLTKVRYSSVHILTESALGNRQACNPVGSEDVVDDY